MWTNELGKGNSHTLNDIPFVLVGGVLVFHMGRSLRMKDIPHNRFGNPDYCGRGRSTWAEGRSPPRARR